MGKIPVIDMSGYSIDIPEDQVERSTLKALGKEIVEAVQTVGGLYLKNHGISEEEIKKVVEQSNKFFALPVEVKQKYTFRREDHTGWAGIEAETMVDDQPPNLNENFHFSRVTDNFPPIEELPEYAPAMAKMVDHCKILAQRFLRLLGFGLELEDEDALARLHDPNDKIVSNMKSILYPGIDTIQNVTTMKPGQMRFMEHTDFGTFTLVFQDDVGGLEVLTTDGQWTPVPPIPGAVPINIGDLIERWTGGRLKPTLHRVVMPENSRKSRNSVIFFTNPRNDCIVRCLDGSDKFKPISALDYLMGRWDDMLGYR